ncbi:V-type ATP synthase subunit E [Ruminococcus sp.]|uniref:V-type ATP synthase subunit E n=1 Tax=Ruminococcus sp. TaxID=41978 RepID=UPI002E79E369|nr:V-type ATP synthase subunit E [Ruminococcus sp.]MEE1263213.1 V-type ATP synthase subunit E [Ruminococcus sp.]
MNGGDIILNRIKTDCDEAVKAIRLEADKSRDAVMAEADKEAQSRVKVIVEKNEKKIRQTKAAAQSRSELEIRNALLRQRRREIDKTTAQLLDYFLGLPDGEYFQAIYRLAAQLKGKSGEIMLNNKDLQRLPQDFEGKIREAGLDASVSSTPANILGGFVLKSGDIEENMDFRALINARRDEIEDLINRELFEH